MELEPLDDVEAGKLARRLLDPAETVPGWAVDQLVNRTQGVPGLLVELVRGLKREGLVRKHEGGTGYYVAGEVLARLPDMPILSWSTSREVESLPAELTAHARLASIWGRPFKPADIEHLIGVIERDGPLEEVVLDAEVGIARLLQAGLLVVRRNATYDFRSVLLRETLYESTPAALRTRVHKAAYTLQAEVPEPYSAEVMANLARHAGPSGQPRAATHWYVALGQRALERQVYQEAATMLDAALEYAAGDDAAIEDILYKRGMARFPARALCRRGGRLCALGRARRRSAKRRPDKPHRCSRRRWSPTGCTSSSAPVRWSKRRAACARPIPRRASSSKCWWPSAGPATAKTITKRRSNCSTPPPPKRKPSATKGTRCS